jgi:hypothetical protein
VQASHPQIAARREQGPIQTADVIVTVNERLARRAYLIFGTMWTCYVFIIYGALGALFPQGGRTQETLLYWSNWVQLWSLPLLMVGAVVISRTADKRAQQQFTDVEAILHEQARMLELQRQTITLLTDDAVIGGSR